jgi:hypothetical protein
VKKPESFLRANDQDDDDPLNDPKTREEEEKASREVTDRLLLPSRLGAVFGEAFQYVAIAFIVMSFFLNMNGYSFLFKDGSLTIDTLEARQFQDEIVRIRRP